jgi:glutaminyl-tRNA synthetase
VPEPGDDFVSDLNPDSLKVLNSCCIEPALSAVLNDNKNNKYFNEKLSNQKRFQLERLGYFCLDGKDSKDNKPVINRTVTLRDTWAKMQKQKQEDKKIRS